MPEVIQKYVQQIEDPRGISYDIYIYGDEREDRTWEGWIEFHPAGGVGPALRTERETSQPDRGALAYWASGLEPIYLEGALGRSR